MANNNNQLEQIKYILIIIAVLIGLLLMHQYSQSIDAETKQANREFVYLIFWIVGGLVIVWSIFKAIKESIMDDWFDKIKPNWDQKKYWTLFGLILERAWYIFIFGVLAVSIYLDPQSWLDIFK